MRWLSILLCLLIALAPLVAADSGSDDDLRDAEEDTLDLRSGQDDSETRIRVRSDGELETRIRTADGEEIRTRTREGETEERYRNAQGDEIRTRTRILADNTTLERLRARLGDGEIELRGRSRAGELLDQELRARLSEEHLDRLARMSPAAIAALGESGQLEHVLDRVRIANASEIRIRSRIVSDGDELRVRLRERVQAYSEDKGHYDEHRAEFLSARERLEACEADNGTCEQVRNEVHAHAQESLLGAIDALIAHLEGVRYAAEADESISEEESSAILAHVAGMIERAQALRIQAQSAQDGPAVSAAARELGDLMREAKAKSAHTRTRTDGSQTLNMLRRAEALDAQLACTLEGVDATVNTALFEQLLAQARVVLDEARLLYEEEKLDDARARIREARGMLQDAQDEAKLIIAELESQGVELADCEVAIVEEEFSEADLETELEEVTA